MSEKKNMQKTLKANAVAKTRHAGDILSECATIYSERRNVYGDNYKRVGAVMNAFFPAGVTLKNEEDQLRYELFISCVVKMSRYAENFYRGGHHDSLVDNSVYSAMLAAVDEELRAKKEV